MMDGKRVSGRGSRSVDRTVLFGAGGVCVVVIALTAMNRATADRFFTNLFNGMTTNFAWFYMLLVSSFLIFLIWLAFGKTGNIKLGPDNEPPAYRFSSWFFMMFAAGMGIGLVFYSVAEPMSQFMAPPTGDAGTVQAAKDAMAYTFLHWGIHPWACYAVVGVTLAYYQHRRGMPALISSCFAPLVGVKRVEGTFGSIVNILALIVTIFGVASSLGMGAIQISAGLGYEFGLPHGVGMMLAIVAIATVLFTCSAVAGIDRGISLLSNINLWIFIVLTFIMFFAGPMRFLLDFFSESIGAYLDILIFDSFWTDAFGETGGWVNSWTVFYWAWWVSWVPFVGSFIARISRGRTIREFIVGSLFLPAIFSFFFMAVMGGNAIHATLGGVTTIAEATTENIAFSLFALFNQFPMSRFLSIIAMVLLLIFFITSADSATFVCSMMTCHGVQDPPNGIKVFWAVILGSSAAILLASGGLTALQSAAITASFPFAVVTIGIMAGMIKAVRQEFSPGTNERRSFEDTIAMQNEWSGRQTAGDMALTLKSVTLSGEQLMLANSYAHVVMNSNARLPSNPYVTRAYYGEGVSGGADGRAGRSGPDEGGGNHGKADRMEDGG